MIILSGSSYDISTVETTRFDKRLSNQKGVWFEEKRAKYERKTSDNHWLPWRRQSCQHRSNKSSKASPSSRLESRPAIYQAPASNGVPLSLLHRDALFHCIKTTLILGIDMSHQYLLAGENYIISFMHWTTVTPYQIWWILFTLLIVKTVIETQQNCKVFKLQ